MLINTPLGFRPLACKSVKKTPSFDASQSALVGNSHLTSVRDSLEEDVSASKANFSVETQAIARGA